MKHKLVIVIGLAVLVLACQCQLPQLFAPATPTPMPTLTPSPTPTPLPTSTPIPGPTSGSSSCTRDEVVRELEATLDFDLFNVHYQIIDRRAILVLWMVDAHIASGQMSLQENQQIAFQDALQAAAQIRQASGDCLRTAFDIVNIIVVDPAYFGWLSIAIPAAAIPSTETLSPSDAAALANISSISYLREIEPAAYGAPPTGSCDWRQAEQRIQQHFAASRPNVAFQFIIDESGVNVWAQWNGPTDQAIVMANLLNIAMEIQCLYPAPTQLFAVIVDDEGEIQQIGQLIVNPDNYMDLSTYTILYPR